jgi:hypothetical protein
MQCIGSLFILYGSGSRSTEECISRSRYDVFPLTISCLKKKSLWPVYSDSIALNEELRPSSGYTLSLISADVSSFSANFSFLSADFSSFSANFSSLSADFSSISFLNWLQAPGAVSMQCES